jgi:hypothetical protein
MVHGAFYDFVRRPSFISAQVARLMKSWYRVRVMMNNIPRVGDIRESLRSIT